LQHIARPGHLRSLAVSLTVVLTVLSATMSLVAATINADAAGADPSSVAPAALAAGGSVNQVYVTGATPGARLVLVDADGTAVAHGRADDAGSFLFRDVTAGTGYRVRSGGSPAVRSDRLTVLGPDEHPTSSFYAAQRLEPGFGYLTTRDHTSLAVDVRLPGPPEDGPYPTVVEYSGYDPANPDSNQAASRLAETLGYATVGVNMRGTGCSGGAFEYFEPLQSLDGYDAIEVVASQPWVLNGKVGMVGISYAGISQLFVAATRPPHLAAITPLSVIDDTYRGVLYPGGILNTGFAVPWGQDRQDDARPAPDGGQGWARRRVLAGDDVCRQNQALRLQTSDVAAEIAANRFYDPARLDHATPDLFVDRIQVPTFLGGAWQDEETGGHWPELISRFSPHTTVRATITNGTHAESLLPSVITRWAEFLDFYVARKIPRIPDDVRAAAAENYARVIGVPVGLPPDRFAGETDVAAALAKYEAEPPVRILFDNGAGAEPGVPVPGFEASFDRWPAPGVTAATWYLGSDGALTRERPRSARSSRGNAADEYRYDPASVPATSHPSPDDDFFAALPAYDWEPVADGTALAYVTPPLTHDTVMLGPASADLWLRSSARDVDLEVVVTEVRPDGKETYVQSGWLRASHRALDQKASTPLEPVQTHTRPDAAPLPRDQYALVRVPIFPFAHAFRAGSRVRVIVQAPGGNRPRWAFDALPARGIVTNDVSRSAARPSKVVLPVIGGIDVPTLLPACPALRGQPCREYVTPAPDTVAP
jgi:uncharacterized protein